MKKESLDEVKSLINYINENESKFDAGFVNIENPSGKAGM